jgi:mercuric reductase
MKTYEYTISGMTCEGCAGTIEKSLAIDGVSVVSVDHKSEKAFVTFDETMTNEQQIISTINQIGHYKVSAYKVYAQEKQESRHLIIIGGGSAAFAATIQAHGLGIKITMINDGLPIGGTCVNVGCIPSKNLMRAAESVFKANNNPFSGIDSKASVVDFKALMNEKRQLVHELREQKYINIIKDMPNFELINARAKVISANSVEANGQIIEGSHILIATGARPLVTPIPGIDKISYLSNEEVFELETLPESMIVLGGSCVALEIAQIFSRLGSKVTILQRSDHILSHELPDISNELSRHLTDEGIDIITGNAIQQVLEENGQVIVRSIVDGAAHEFSAQKLIIATGRKANTENMGLEESGIALEKNGGIAVNAFLQTSMKSIYAAGDVTGSNMFVYTAAYEGKTAVNNAFSSKVQATDYSILPWVIFTDPQVAGLGMDESQAKEKGLDVDTAVLPLNHVPRSIAANDTRGFIKLIRNKKENTLIGARIVAPEGSELLMELAVMIRSGITIEELKDLLHPYLTLSEGIKLAAIAFDKDVSELSCCAT